MVGYLKAFHHVGLLVNEPPGPAGLPFIESSDDLDPSSYRSRLPVRTSSISLLIVCAGREKQVNYFLFLRMIDAWMAGESTIQAGSPPGEDRTWDDYER